MLIPKRVKRRKQHRGKIRGRAHKGNIIAYGEYGLVAEEGGRITSNQIEAARIAMTRFIKRGGKAVLGQIDAVPQSWESPLAAFENVYAHECKVSALINNLLELAKAEHDFASEDFLWQFVREQVEEEATASGIVNRLKRMGATAIFNLDQEYGARK